MSKTLTYQQALRYNRQIVLPAFDLAGQEALFNASVLVIGLGGLGCASAQYLAAAGVGQLTLVDDDKVDLSNLQRQVLHTERDVGRDKVASAYDSLSSINSDITLRSIAQRMDDKQLSEEISQHTLVLDCCDNLATRNQINRLCWQLNTPLISAAAIRMEGQLMAVLPHRGGPCYACLSRLFGEQTLSCTEAGILSPVVGIIGSTQALMAIKVLTEHDSELQGQLHLYDASKMSWERFSITQNTDCEVCAVPHTQ